MVRGIKLAALGAVATLVVAIPGTALAAEGAAVYHPDVNARSFFTGDGGWERGSDTTGLCIPPLTCPSIGGGFVAGGGTFGPTDGYVETTIGGLTGVGSESRGILRSPPFTYNGVNGEKPTELLFGLNNLNRLTSLLSVTGNSVDYSVELVPVSGGGALRIVDAKPLVATESWSNNALTQINTGALVIGQNYRFRITTRFIYGAQVIPGGSLGYDDVTLLAVREEADVPAGGTGGNNGNNGGNNNPGGNSAVFDGRNLFINLKCFGQQGKNGKCQTRATAFKVKGGTRYTFPIQRVVKAKKGKVIRARVRFQFRKELERRKSITLKSVLREDRDDPTKVTKYKKLKLIDKG